MKTITQTFIAMLLPTIAWAQLFNNGPLVNAPGAGAGGANVSHLHSGMTTFGFGHALSAKYRVADDFTLPPGVTCYIDSIVFFAYQTNSTTTSTINHVNWAIWDASPMAGGQIIAGDTTANDLDYTYWSGIYRTTEADLQNTQRPIMANRVSTTGLVLVSGTYWLSWQTGGITTLTGPWAPPVTITGVTNTGNAIQFDPTAPNNGAWNNIIDGGSNTQQGLPFFIYGTITGIAENQMTASVSVYPNPATDIMAVRVIGASAPVFAEIINIHGQTVYSFKETHPVFAHNINVSNWAKGVYLVRLTYSDKTHNLRVVIE